MTFRHLVQTPFPPDCNLLVTSGVTASGRVIRIYSIKLAVSKVEIDHCLEEKQQSDLQSGKQIKQIFPETKGLQ